MGLANLRTGESIEEQRILGMFLGNELLGLSCGRQTELCGGCFASTS